MGVKVKRHGNGQAHAEFSKCDISEDGQVYGETGREPGTGEVEKSRHSVHQRSPPDLYRRQQVQILGCYRTPDFRESLTIVSA